ncbi:MAG: PepSY domain-containing protein [Candidatus Latescibacteria bacterium]|nr:PepSY domain-containing protein [Candidatus Latescibacterota bacterium]
MSHDADTAMGSDGTDAGPLSPEHNRFLNTFTKWIRLIHRYLALVFNLGFLLWFLSGFVMMYTDFPSLSLYESLALRKPLSSREIRLLPQTAHRQSGIETSLSSARVGMVVDRPVYWFQDRHGQVQTVYADTGERFVVDTALVRRIANACQEPAPSIHHIDQMAELDQWTPTPDYVPHMPMYRVDLNDGPRTVLYVSSATGEIVQRLNARDKLWAWLGPIPHWVYLRDLRVHDDLWRQVVIWSSALGVVMCLAGMIQGVVRYERKKGVLTFSPYTQRWFRWHHSAGFLFGFFVLTWILSGLLSMDPLRWSPSRSLSDGENLRWQGGALTLQNFQVPPGRAVDIVATDGHSPVKELHLIQVQARPYYLAYVAGDTTLLLAADAAAPKPMNRLPEDELLTAVKRVNPSPIAESRLLTDYDAYYYAKDRTKPLPVFRVKMDDAPSTWYYISPQTGAVVDIYQSLSRVNRWVYHGLHSVDFPQIFFKRPLWDIIVIILLTGGTTVSVTGVILFFRWMRRKSAHAVRVGRAPITKG